MVSVFFFDLLYALGVAISPTPVILVILMLFGVRGQKNALGYLIGWIVGLILLGVIIFSLAAAGLIFLNETSGFIRPGIRVLLALLVLWFAYRRWTKPIEPEKDMETPMWLSSVDQIISRADGAITPVRAFALAVVMSAISPKNIVLMIAAVLAFTQVDLQAQYIVLLFALFVAISSLSIGIPVGYALLKGDKASESLNNWKTWVLTNSPRAVALLLAMVGLVMLVNALGDLSMQFSS